jgi:hypothetical protein
VQGVPAGVRSKAFRALVKVLQGNPRLARLVKTWRTWSGEGPDDDPPTKGQLPWVRLTPLGMPAERKGTHAVGSSRGLVYRSPLKVTVELAVAGPRVDDLADLWEQFEAAIWPATAAEQASLDAALGVAGIRDVRLVQPALATGLDNVSAEMTLGDGVLELDLWVILGPTS